MRPPDSTHFTPLTREEVDEFIKEHYPVHVEWARPGARWFPKDIDSSGMVTLFAPVSGNEMRAPWTSLRKTRRHMEEPLPKVLFLDVDGVLNHHRTPTEFKDRPNGERALIARDNYCVFLANMIVESTGCKVVLSSSWRHSKTWREDIADQGFIHELHDRTTLEGPEDERGRQVHEWLEQHPAYRYAILDDNNWFLAKQQPNFFKTDFHNGGLTDEIAKKVIDYLGAVPLPKRHHGMEMIQVD